MPATQEPRYQLYGVVHAYTGVVATKHQTRSQAEAALNARPDRFAYRVRGLVPAKRRKATLADLFRRRTST